MLDQSVSVVDQVIAAIERGIQTARFAPGQRLIETELMAELGVSRGPVREAFRRLTAKGWLQWERYRGVSVVRMTRQQVYNLTNIRSVLEGYAASLAAAKIDKKGFAELTSLERTGSKAAKASSSYHEYNLRFHRLIISLSGNSEIPNFIELTQFPIFRLQFSTILLSSKHMLRSRQDHTRITEAILAGNSRAAEAAMRQHISNTNTGIMEEAPSHFFAN